MSTHSEGQRPSVTAILTEAGVVTEAQIEAGLIHQQETGRRIGECLVELGYVSEEDIAWALARQLGLSFVDVRGETLDPALVKSVPEAVLRRLQFVPIVRSEDRLIVAAADPTDHEAVRELEQLAGTQVDCVSATASSIERALDEVLGSRPARRPRPSVPDSGVRYDVMWERSGETFLQFHLAQALRTGAAEIHFVHAGGSLHILHRIGTQVCPAFHEPADVMDVLTGRLEALGMPAAEDDESHQCFSTVIDLDGKARTIQASRLAGRDRVSITVRLLHDPGERARLDHLGLDALDLARLRGLATEPSGLVLVCGPAGSGCSTTLAALLAELPTEERRWLVFARDQRCWPMLSGLVDVITGPPVRHWRDISVAHGADGLVLDGGLEGRRVAAVLGSASHGRWVLARSDWEDTFSLIDWLARHPNGRALLARRLRVVIQQRLVFAPPAPGEPGARRSVFEVLFVTDALRTAIQQGAGSAHLAVMARADGFKALAERVRDGVANGLYDAGDAARATA